VADLLKALDSVDIKSIKATDIKPKVSKEEKKYGITVDTLKPRLWLRDEALKTIDKYQVGDKIYLAIEGTVNSMSQDKQGTKKRIEINITIDKVADLTRGGRS
jgi:ribosomal protein L28